jgi:hypothetical protein
VRPPPEWGVETRLRDLFGDRVTGLRVTRREFVFRFASATDFADCSRTHYGPPLKAFEALDEAAGKLLHDDLVELAERHNAATDGTVKIPSAYVEVLAYKA